jgi:hypothetical protein
MYGLEALQTDEQRLKALSLTETIAAFKTALRAKRTAEKRWVMWTAELLRRGMTLAEIEEIENAAD